MSTISGRLTQGCTGVVEWSERMEKVFFGMFLLINQTHILLLITQSIPSDMRWWLEQPHNLSWIYPTASCGCFAKLLRRMANTYTDEHSNPTRHGSRVRSE